MATNIIIGLTTFGLGSRIAAVQTLEAKLIEAFIEMLPPFASDYLLS